MPTSPSDTFPGWRPDPTAPDIERFWNGVAWTDKTRPVGREVAPHRAEAETGEGESGEGGAGVPGREIDTPDGIAIWASSTAASAPDLRAEPAVVPAVGPPGEPLADSLTADAPPASTRSSTHDDAPLQAARSVQLAQTGSKRAGRSSKRRRVRTMIVVLLCLAIGAGAGFAAGYLIGTDDNDSVDQGPASSADD